MTILITRDAFEPWQALAEHEATLRPGRVGACVSFIGTMRDFNDGKDVAGMTLEHYPGMTEKQLGEIIARTSGQWPLLETLVVHRVGDINPGDSIVLAAVWSAHRAAAFEACRYLMEALKSEATFWKKERLLDQSERWVSKNTAGYSNP